MTTSKIHFQVFWAVGSLWCDCSGKLGQNAKKLLGAIDLTRLVWIEISIAVIHQAPGFKSVVCPITRTLFPILRSGQRIQNAQNSLSLVWKWHSLTSCICWKTEWLFYFLVSDTRQGGVDTVSFLTVWGHFTPFKIFPLLPHSSSCTRTAELMFLWW